MQVHFLQKAMLLIGLFFGYIGGNYAQVSSNDKNALGAKAAAIGTASVTLSDTYAVFANQAGLADIDQISASFFGENRFLIKDLNLFGLSVALPTKSGTFGIGVSYFGNEFYNESQVRVAYGRKLADKLSIGVELDFAALAIADNGNKSAVTFGLGFQYQLLEDFKIGFHAYNPLRIQLSDHPLPSVEDDFLPTILKFGMAYSPSEKVNILAEVEQNNIQSPIFKVGIDYQLIEQLYLRAGISSDPTSSSFGLGLNLGLLQIDIASSFHPTLGYTPSISLSFLGKKKNPSAIDK